MEEQEKALEYSKKTHDKIRIKESGKVIIRKKKRRASDEDKLLSRNEILTMIENIPANIGKFEKKGLMYRALIAMLYLTGARISELITIKKNQFEYAESRGIKYLIINNVPTLKRRDKFFRPFFLRKDFEEPFIRHVRVWLDELFNEDQLLFPFNSSRAWQIVEKYTGKYDHYFRHVRSIDLVRYYGFNSYWLQRWHGWKKLQSGEAYVHLVGQDLKDMILDIKPERSF